MASSVRDASLSDGVRTEAPIRTQRSPAVQPRSVFGRIRPALGGHNVPVMTRTKPIPQTGQRVVPAPNRVVVDVRRPVVDGGRYAAKGSLGAPVVVEADVFGDGHDHVDASLWVCRPGGDWVETPMEPQGNDRWRATFTPDALGRWEIRVDGWIDRFGTWRAATQVKRAAGLDIDLELHQGAELLGADRDEAERWLIDPDLVPVARRRLDRSPVTTSPAYAVQVEPERARFSAWYELFPRSTVDGTVRHGTL